jgi:hypothetical protein
MEFRPCLAPCDRCRCPPRRDDCDGSRWLRHLPKETPRPHPSTGPEGLWDASGSAPRGGPPRRSAHPKVHGCRRHRDASPKRLVRDPALTPKSGSRWFELVLAILPRSPAYMMSRLLAADAHTRRCLRLRATRVHRERCYAEPNRRNPEGLHPWASRRRHPEVGPWRLVAPASPASWRAGSGQTVIVFTGTAAPRSEDRAASPIRRSESRRRSAGGAVGAAHPTCGGDPPRAPKCPCRDGPQSIPGSPDRGRGCFRSECAEALSEPRAA